MSALIIKGKPKCSTVDLVKSLGFENATFKENSELSNYIFPDSGVIAIADWDGFTVITHYVVAWHVIEPELTNTSFQWSEVLEKYFEDKDLLAIHLQSTVNGYGFALVENGNINRTLLGDSQIEPIEWGEMTAIEKKYFDLSYVEDGERIYQIDGETYTHDAIGEEIVLEQLEKFTGKGSGEIYELSAEVFSI